MPKVEEVDALAQSLELAAVSLRARARAFRDWEESLYTRTAQLEAQERTRAEDYAEQRRLLEARERAVADVRQVSADRLAAINTLKQAVENEKAKAAEARRAESGLREQVKRLEATLADALARREA